MPFYSLYVMLFWHPMFSQRHESSGMPCAVDQDSWNILAPTRDPNQGPLGPQSRIVTTMLPLLMVIDFVIAVVIIVIVVVNDVVSAVSVVDIICLHCLHASIGWSVIRQNWLVFIFQFSIYSNCIIHWLGHFQCYSLEIEVNYNCLTNSKMVYVRYYQGSLDILQIPKCSDIGSCRRTDWVPKDSLESFSHQMSQNSHQVLNAIYPVIIEFFYDYMVMPDFISSSLSSTSLRQSLHWPWFKPKLMNAPKEYSVVDNWLIFSDTFFTEQNKPPSQIALFSQTQSEKPVVQHNRLLTNLDMNWCRIMNIIFLLDWITTFDCIHFNI